MIPPDASILSIPQHQPKKFRHIGIMYLVIMSVLYSGNSILAKIITAGAVQIGFFRTCLMYMVVLPIMLKPGIRGVDDLLGPRRLRVLLLLRGLCGSVGGLLFYLAIKHTSPGLATSISFLDVVLTPFFGRIFLKESLTPLDIVFAFISFTGVILIARPPFLFPTLSNSENFIGIVYAVLGALIATFSYVFLRKIGTSVSSLVPTFYYGAVGSILYFMLLLITGNFEFPCLPQLGLMCLLSLCGLLGVVFFTLALHTERPSTAAVINTLQIVFVFVAQVLILDDIPSTLSIIGSCLIFSAEVRSREFDVLKKVSHRNIVRLYAVEEEVSSKNSVIIMELCTAGSLFLMLDDPENMYGLPEDGFKVVLRDISAGMNHLREKGIVHRDLKPGNIMRSWEPDGSPVYKLTDFGAARELDDNEQFVSLYGTEEYLHPDIYERAVLRKPAGKTFTATVDLWSMGVTLYHVATGALPFRPYGGARRNKETMFKITTEKPSGVISGVQYSENGDIDWSRELPKTCRFSVGFKTYFTPILAGILECNPHQIWTFEQYFSEVSSLLEKRVVDVFSVPSGALHKIYVPEGNTHASMQELIAEQTDIRSSHQALYFDGDLLQVEAFQPVKNYPRTTISKPLILLSTNVADFQSIHIPHTCKPPKDKTSSTSSLETDANLIKVCSSTLFDIRKSVDYLLKVQTLIRLGIKWFVNYIHSWVSKTKVLASEVQSKMDCLKTSLEIFEEHYNRETALLKLICKITPAPTEVNELKLFFPQITERNKHLRQLRTEFEIVSESLRKMEKVIVHDKIPLQVFIDEGSRESDRLVEKMDVIANRSRDIYRAFRKHKHLKRLSSHEEQIHKFDKQQFFAICSDAVGLFTEKSVPGCKKMHKESNLWFTGMKEFQSQLAEAEMRLISLKEQCEQQSEQQLQMQRVYRNKLNVAESSLDESMSRLSMVSQSSIPDVKPSSWPVSQRSLSCHRITELQESVKGAKSSFVEIRTEMDNNTKMLQRLQELLNVSNDGEVLLNNHKTNFTEETMDQE